jgi:hypothetical protein
MLLRSLGPRRFGLLQTSRAPQTHRKCASFTADAGMDSICASRVPGTIVKSFRSHGAVRGRSPAISWGTTKKPQCNILEATFFYNLTLKFDEKTSVSRERTL